MEATVTPRCHDFGHLPPSADTRIGLSVKCEAFNLHLNIDTEASSLHKNVELMSVLLVT